MVTIRVGIVCGGGGAVVALCWDAKVVVVVVVVVVVAAVGRVGFGASTSLTVTKSMLLRQSYSSLAKSV